MDRVLRFTTEAKAQLAELQSSPSHEGLLGQVRKSLGYLQVNPSHSSLKTHEFTSLSTKDYKVYEAYAQNNTPGAYRIFWRYGPDELSTAKKRIAVITIIAITPHR